MLADRAHKIISTSGELFIFPNYGIVYLVNRCLMTLPRKALVLRFLVFKYKYKETHADVSAKMQGGILPFLWISLMGMINKYVPEEDPILHTALGTS